MSSASKKCPNCGLVNLSNITSCKRCATSLTQVQSQVSQPTNVSIDNTQNKNDKKIFGLSKNQIILIASISTLFFLSFIIVVVGVVRNMKKESDLRIAQIKAEAIKSAKKTNKLSQMKAMEFNLANLLDEYGRIKDIAAVDKKYKGRAVEIFADLESFEKTGTGKYYLSMSQKANPKYEFDSLTGKNIEVDRPIKLIQAICLLDNSCIKNELYFVIAGTEEQIVPGSTFRFKSIKVKGIYKGNVSTDNIPQVVIENAVFLHDGKWACDSDVEIE